MSNAYLAETYLEPWYTQHDPHIFTLEEQLAYSLDRRAIQKAGAEVLLTSPRARQLMENRWARKVGRGQDAS